MVRSLENSSPRNESRRERVLMIKYKQDLTNHSSSCRCSKSIISILVHIPLLIYTHGLYISNKTAHILTEINSMKLVTNSRLVQ